MATNGRLNSILQKRLLISMMRIRTVEDQIVTVYPDKQMRTPTHLSIGQEAVAVGVCEGLRQEDQVFTSHRCHAHFLAKGGSIEALFGELCGRVTGCNKGRAGSAHLADCKVGIFASPILGSMIPIAAGAALSFKMNRSKNVAVAIFGDAAIEEGVFAESVNFAVLKKLPVLFVCENNFYSTHSHIKFRQPPSSIHQRIKIPELKTQQLDGNDVEKVYQVASHAIHQCRVGKGPVFIECLTYRIREHVGPLMDYDKGYRTKREVESWMKKCPIKRFKAKLTTEKIMTSQEIDVLTEKLKKYVEQAYAKALQSPWPDTKTLSDHVY